MSKRFTETMKWKDPWFRALPPKQKLLWLFIVDECDNAGVWKVDLPIAAVYIGETVGKEDLLAFNDGIKDRVKLFEQDTLLLVREFVEFQIIHLNAIGESTKMTNLQKNCVVKVVEYIQAERLAEEDYGILTGKLPVLYDMVTGIGKGNGKGRGKDKGNTYKDWDKEKLVESCRNVNDPVVLRADEISDFADYWMEQSASGKTNLSMQKTWDTRRRMQTALKLVYAKNRAGGRHDPTSVLG